MKYLSAILLYLLLVSSIEAQTRNVGDLITNNDGSQGVVFWIHPDGSGGWMVALNDLPASIWSTAAGQIPGLLPYSEIDEALGDTSGYRNTKMIRECLETTGTYAAQLVDFSHGWYLPAAGQFRKLVGAYLFILPILTTNGGSELAKNQYYWTSTTHPFSNEAWGVASFGAMMTINRSGSNKIRAVRSFTTKTITYDTTLTYQWNTGETAPHIDVSPATTSGYSVTVSTSMGCTDKATKQIFVGGGSDTIRAVIRRGETYTNNGFNESMPGTYTKTLGNPGGCNTSATLILDVLEPVSTLLFDTICSGEAYTQNNFTEWDAGSYTQRWKAANGCDSTVTLNLHVHPSYIKTFNASICRGETYTGNGFNVDRAGTHYLRLQSSSGCDSVLTLNLGYFPDYRRNYYDSLRKGETFAKYGFHVTAPGVHVQNLKTDSNCDSVIILNLVLCQEVNTITGAICQGETYNAFGFNESEAGAYTQRLQGVTGNDSIVILSLTVNPVYQTDYRDTIGEGETYTLHGFDVSVPGIYHQNLQSASGCDSILTLHLVSSQKDKTFNASICQGETYTENNFNESETGTYYQYLINGNGEDSTVTLHLTVNPTYHTTLNGALCPGKTYSEHGFNVSVPGVYHRNLQAASGCDSIITLNLITAPIYNEVVDATICEGEAYTQNGFNETRPGTYYLRLHSASGCDSVITLNLLVNPSYYFERNVTICQGESYDFKGTILHETGTYYDNYQTTTGCDSIYELNLTVKPAYIKRIDAFICEGTSYTDYGFNVSVPGTHIRRAASANGCDSVFTLQLEVEGIEGIVNIDLMDCTTHDYGFRFDNRTNAPATGYAWDFGDGTVSTEEAPAHRYAKEGTYPASLAVTTGNGCETILLHHIDVPYYVNPIPIYASRKGINNEDGLITFRTDPIEGLKYKWDLGDGTSGNGYEVEHRYNAEAQEYYNVRLTVNNSDDCLMEQEFQLKSFKVVYPPNTFSPNDDGINDVFLKGYRVQILNRNGIIIFKGEDGWDGTRKGEQATEDTYFYEAHYMTEEGKKTKTGYITLIR